MLGVERANLYSAQFGLIMSRLLVIPLLKQTKGSVIVSWIAQHLILRPFNNKRIGIATLLTSLGLLTPAPAVLATETVKYYYTDNLGTVMAETDASGVLGSFTDYRPFGSIALGSVEAGPSYTGHVSDPESGFIYMQGRYYDPSMGRFLSVDPERPTTGSTFSFGRYTYTNDNPLRYLDLDGRQTAEEFQARDHCGDCSLVAQRDGTFIAVPTVIAARVTATIALGGNDYVAMTNPAKGTDVAMVTDRASSALALSALGSVEFPPAAVAFGVGDEALTIVSFVAEPNASHALNVASVGLFRVAKVAVKGEKVGEKIMEVIEKAGKVTEVTEQVDKENERHRQEKEKKDPPPPSQQ